MQVHNAQDSIRHDDRCTVGNQACVHLLQNFEQWCELARALHEDIYSLPLDACLFREKRLWL